jgi:hypothetical protein
VSSAAASQRGLGRCVPRPSRRQRISYMYTYIVQLSTCSVQHAAAQESANTVPLHTHSAAAVNVTERLSHPFRVLWRNAARLRWPGLAWPAARAALRPRLAHAVPRQHAAHVPARPRRVLLAVRAAQRSTKKRDAPLAPLRRSFAASLRSTTAAASLLTFCFAFAFVRASNARAPVALMVAFAPTLCGHSAMQSHTA